MIYPEVFLCVINSIFIGVYSAPLFIQPRVYLLMAYYLPDTFLGTGETSVSKTGNCLPLGNCVWGEISQINTLQRTHEADRDSEENKQGWGRKVRRTSVTRGHLGKVRMEARFFAASHLLGPQASLVLTVFPQVFLPMASRCLILISVSFILWNPCSLSGVQCEGVWGTCLLFLGCPPLVWAVGLASAYTVLLLSTFSFGCVCLHSCHGSFSSHLCLGDLLLRACLFRYVGIFASSSPFGFL